MPDLRVAILIGVRDYPKFGGLDSPYQDVAVLRECLRNMGFDMIIERAQNHRAPKSKRVIVEAIEEARTRLAALPEASAGGGPVVLFYFAGHGLSTQGRNFILAEDFDPNAAAALSVDALDIDREIATRLTVRSDIQSIILIDACRNELTRAVGENFVEPAFVPGRTVFSFSTSPGQRARDGGRADCSAYSRALSTFLPVRGSIQECLSTVSQAVYQDTWGQQRPQTIDYGVTIWLAGRPEALSPSVAMPAAPQTPRRSYTDREVAKLGHQIHKLKAKDTTGRWAFYFVLIEPAFESAFLEAMRGNRTLELDRYGVVIASCYGETPNREVIEYLNDRYGFDMPLPAESNVRPAPTPPKPVPPMMAALRQHLGFGSWRTLVVLVSPQNRMPFAHAADQLAALDRSGLGTDGRGPLGAVRKLVDSASTSQFDIEQLGRFGLVVYRGSGATIPPRVQADLQGHYGVRFDWSEWETLNGVIADVQIAPPPRR